MTAKQERRLLRVTGGAPRDLDRSRQKKTDPDSTEPNRKQAARAEIPGATFSRSNPAADEFELMSHDELVALGRRTSRARGPRQSESSTTI